MFQDSDQYFRKIILRMELGGSYVSNGMWDGEDKIYLKDGY